MRSLVVPLLAAIGLVVAPHVAGAQPTVAVMISSTVDHSPGQLDARVRGQHGEIARRTLRDVLRRSGADVRLAAIGARKLDVSVVKWKIAPSGPQLDVTVELRVIVADEHGRMLSILTGRAKVSAPGETPIAQLREEAIAEAVRGMTPALQAQLRRDVG